MLPETKADVKAKAKIEKKMSKILTPEQFAKWKEIEARPKMPMPGMGRPEGAGPRGEGRPGGRPGMGGPQQGQQQ